MDADFAAGTRSDAQAVAFMQRRAIPKQLHQAKPSDLVKFPTSTVQQVIQRQRAEEAAQKGFPPSVNGVDADLIVKAQGVEGAARKAASRVDFDAFEQHQSNIERILTLQEQTRRGKQVLGATADIMNLGHALGSAHDELRPQTRAAIEQRANQLRSLVGSTTVDAHLAGGRALQQAYATRNQNDTVMRALMINKARDHKFFFHGSDGRSLHTFGGLGASAASAPGRGAYSAPTMRGPRSIASAATGTSATLPMSDVTSLPSAPSGASSLDSLERSYWALGYLGREGFDTGYLPARQ